MKKKNSIWCLLTLMMVAMLGVGIASCGGSDDDEGGGGSGGKTTTEKWYFTGRPGCAIWVGLLIDWEGYKTAGEVVGEHVNGDQCVIHILNSNTLQVLTDDYCGYGNKITGKQLLYRWNSPVGTLGFYCSHPVTYTYEKYENNKIYVYTWGKFFTVLGDALIMDGGDSFYAYDPESEYVSVNLN